MIKIIHTISRVVASAFLKLHKEDVKNIIIQIISFVAKKALKNTSVKKEENHKRHSVPQLKIFVHLCPHDSLTGRDKKTTRSAHHGKNTTLCFKRRRWPRASVEEIQVEMKNASVDEGNKKKGKQLRQKKNATYSDHTMPKWRVQTQDDTFVDGDHGRKEEKGEKRLRQTNECHRSTVRSQGSPVQSENPTRRQSTTTRREHGGKRVPVLLNFAFSMRRRRTPKEGRRHNHSSKHDARIPRRCAAKRYRAMEMKNLWYWNFYTKKDGAKRTKENTKT